MTIMGPKVLPHPASLIFPMMEESELADLAKNIKAHGLRLPVILHPDTRILDGRNRYEACLRVDVKPEFTTWGGKPGTEIDFVLSVNLQRRHLTVSQRSVVAARIREQYAAIAKERQRLAGGDRKTDTGKDRGTLSLNSEEAIESAVKAAERMGVSPASVYTAAKVLRNGVDELVAAVDRGEVSVQTAAVIAEEPKEKQEEIVAYGEAQILAKAKEIRERRKEQNLEALLSSETNEHYSPPTVVELARRVMGGIDLDPASCEAANKVVGAKKIYTEADDGLTNLWAGRIWLNPPFGRTGDNRSSQGKWSAHLINLYRAGEIEQACLLVGSATSERWFQPLWDAPIAFPDGRLDFWTVDEAGNRVEERQPTRSTVVAYFGPNVEAFVREFSMIGRVVVPQRLMTQAIADLDKGNVSATISAAPRTRGKLDEIGDAA